MNRRVTLLDLPMKIAIIVLLLMISVSSMYADDGSTPDRDEDLTEGIINIGIQGIASQTLFVRFAGDTLFLPLLQLCDFLRIPVTASEDFTLIGGELPLGSPFSINRGKSVAFLDPDSTVIGNGLLRLIGGELYIEQGFFARWLKLPMTYDTVRLRLVISADSRLPRVQLSRDRKKYASLLRDDYMPHLWPQSVVGRQLAGYPTLDWSLAASRRTTVNHVRGLIQVGMPLLYGIFNANVSATHDALDTTSQSLALDWWTWQLFFPDFSPLQRVLLGSNHSDESNQYVLEISNTPLSPRLAYVTEELTGLAQPGWTVEMYDGTRLVDVTRADSTGRYGFVLPVGYGTTTRTIVLVGRHGERYSEERRIEMSPLLVPAGELQYQTRATTTHDAVGNRAEAVAYAGFGVTDRLTVGLEAVLRQSDIQGIAADSIYPALSTGLWVGTSGFLGLRYNPRLSLLKGEASWFSTENITLRLGMDSLSLLDGSFISTGSASYQQGALLYGAMGRYAHIAGRRVIQVQPRLGGYFSGVSFNLSTDLKWTAFDFDEGAITPELRYNRAVMSHLHVVTALIPRLLINGRASYDHQMRNFDALSFSASMYLTRTVGLNFSYSVNAPDWSSPLLQLQVRLDLNRAVGVTVSGDYRDREFGASTYMQGSAQFSSNGTQFSRHPSAGGTTIIVRGFDDTNGNGLWDNGEADLGVQPARLSIGANQMNGKNGMFTSIPANRECLIEVDRWIHADRQIFPRRTMFSLYSAPSSVHTVDVPYASGVDVSGRCEAVSATGAMLKGSVILGLSIHLVALDGSASYDAEIFHDGTLVVIGVAMGDYRIELDQRQLAARRLQVRSMPDSVTVSLTSTHLPVITLEPIPLPDATRDK